MSSYACDAPVGWNTIARRNIALLEALKWGAELIVSIDDDNFPIGPYFKWFGWAFRTFHGIKTTVDQSYVDKWFDPASLQFPLGGGIVSQRGFPQHFVGSRENSFIPITDAKIGVAQGMILGNPDTSACRPHLPAPRGSPGLRTPARRHRHRSEGMLCTSQFAEHRFCPGSLPLLSHGARLSEI